MSCDKDTVACDQLEALKTQAVGFGFDPAWIADIVEKFGPDLLGVVVEAIRQGLSMGTVTDLPQKSAPAVLRLLISTLNNLRAKEFAKTQGFAADATVVPGGVVVEGVESGMLD